MSGGRNVTEFSEPADGDEGEIYLGAGRSHVWLPG